MYINKKNVNIYSRPRINMHHKKERMQKRNRNIIVVRIIIAVFIAILTSMYIIKIINPTIDKILINEVQARISKISNNEAQKIMKEYEYSDLVTIMKDSNNNIAMIRTNSNTINKIASEISINVGDKLKENNNNSIKIYLGTLMGITMLSGIGPKINAKVYSTGNVNTTLKSQFLSEGINQTLHKIYLEIDMNISILTPYHSITSNQCNIVLLTESIIVGNVPESYYYLNSGETIEPSDIIQ